MLLLLACQAPLSPAQRPRPLVSQPLPVEASSITYGNRTRSSYTPLDYTKTPLTGPGVAITGVEGLGLRDNVAFNNKSDDNWDSKINEVNRANGEVSKVNEIRQLNQIIKVKEVGKVNEINKANEGVTEVNKISKGDQISKVNNGTNRVSVKISKVDQINKNNDDSNKVSIGDVKTKANSSETESSASKGVKLIREMMVEGHTKVHPEICPALGAKLKVLILVTSAPHHFAPRQAIRMTWGHFAARADIALSFVLGAPPHALRQQIDEEDALYGDIIEGKFVDTYTNLTLKTLSILEWADKYCPCARRLLKTDDDMFINVPLLLKFIDRRANATNTIWGRVMYKTQPKRNPASKYYLSAVQYPASLLPDYALGSAYLMSSDVIEKLRGAALNETFLFLEDVFFTGVLAARLRVTLVNAPQFYTYDTVRGACALRRRHVAVPMRYHEQFDLWQKLMDGQAKCAE